MTEDEDKFIKRTEIDEGDEEEDDDLVYEGKEYDVPPAKDYGAPSMINKAERDAERESVDSAKLERKKLEEDILKGLKKDRDPVSTLGYTPRGAVSSDEETKAIRVLLRDNPSLDGMKSIATQLQVDMKKVLAVKDEMEEEQARIEREQKILMQQRMIDIQHPEVPRMTPKNTDYEDEEEEYVPRFKKSIRDEDEEGDLFSGKGGMQAFMMKYMMDQNRISAEAGRKSDERLFTMMTTMMTNAQLQNTQMMLEMNKHKGGGFFDGEFGDVFKAKLMAGVLSPNTPEVSGTALILKGLVDSGQLGGILAEAAGLLRDIATKDKGYEQMPLDATDVTALPPNYRKQIPQQVRRPPREEEYEDEYEQPPPPRRPAMKPPQQPQPQPPSEEDYPDASPEWFAQKITERFPGTEWDVSLKASQMIMERAKMLKTNLNDPNEIKEMAKGILALVAGAQGLIVLAKSAKDVLQFDDNGDSHRSPEEAAEFIKREMPDKLEIINRFDWDMMLNTAKYFENCKSTAKPIMFLKHPKISPIVKQFFMLIKNSPPKQPPNLDSNGAEGGEEEFEENPFGGF